jgi:peptide/nickel transport system substrate-binding protein
MVIDDPSTALAMYRTGQIDLAGVRQEDLDALKKSHPHLHYQDWLSNVTSAIYMRTNQPPFHDVRVRRAISHAIDRQGLIDAVAIGGAPSPAVPRGLTEWSLPIYQLGAAAKYYQHDPQEARRLLADVGFPKGFKTQLHATGGYGPGVLDAAQLIQRYLKDVGIEAELKIQEYGAYIATTAAGKFEGMAYGPSSSPGSQIASCMGCMLPTNHGTAAMSMIPSSPPCSRSNGGRRTWKPASASFSICSAIWQSSSTMCT